MDKKNEATLVIDTTYDCNARCTYCRWGERKSAKSNRAASSLILLDPDLLAFARIVRVVFSGGEPLLHPGLCELIAHYSAQNVAERVVMTNGILANRSRIVVTHKAGVTGFAFSVDSLDQTIAEATRGMSRTHHRQALRHFAEFGAYARTNNLELTVNCVLSAANCAVTTIHDLAVWAAANGAVAIKFQPVSDDGYLGAHAPELLLRHSHADVIRTIADDTGNWGINTNRLSFFSDLAAYLDGATLPGSSCKLGRRSYVLQHGGLVICPWVQNRPVTTLDELTEALRQFELMIPTCTTGPHCFCLQPREQRWIDAID